MKKSLLIFTLICVFVPVLYVVGLVFFLSDHEPGDKCEMTYMFEYPQYVKISQHIDYKYPKYGLYAYSEGRMTKNARNMFFNGIPVIFIPGNAGSHQQARSLASVALRKAINSGQNYHFDYFTIDLNSEFSALYGPILFEQLEYVLHSIPRVLELYKGSSNSPSKVVLIGHSVGGLIARKAIANLQKHDKDLVSILITLASPMERAPLYFDRYARQFYGSSHLKKDIVSVSVAGGYSDFMVPTYLTRNEGNLSINVVASHVAKGWVESNHVQILWCKQLVLAINRALFDSVDMTAKQISTNTQLIYKIFQHHLVHNSGSHFHIHNPHPAKVKLDYKGEWIEDIRKQYTVDLKKGLKQPHWYMVGISALPGYDLVTVLAINLEVTDWIYVCSAAYPLKASRVCVEAEPLTQLSEIAPSSRYKRRLVTVNMLEIRKRTKEYSHVVFRALPTSEPVTIHVDVHGSGERSSQVALPFFTLKKRVVVQETPRKSITYNLYFPDLTDPLQVYSLYVEPVRCEAQQHHASASLVVPWANESVHTFFTDSSALKPFLLRLQSGKPPGAGDVTVRLVLEPSCIYQISVRLHLMGILGQIARYYSPFLISTMGVVLLLALQYQIDETRRTKSVPIIFVSLVKGLKQAWLPALAFVSAVFLNDNSVIPTPEFKLFPNNLSTGIAVIFLFLVGFVSVFLLTALYCLSLFTLESTVHKLTLKLLARSVTLTFRFSDYFMTFLHKVPFLVAVALLVLCFSACGGLALCVGMVFYFLKLTQMSQEYVEKIGLFILKKVARFVRRLFAKKKEELKDTGNADRSDTGDTQKEEITSEKEDGDVQAEGEEEDARVETVESTRESTGQELAKKKDDEDDHRIKAFESIFSNLTDTNNSMFFHTSMFFIWVFVTVLNIPEVLTWAHNFRFSRNLYPDESLFPGLVFSIGAFFLWQFELPRTDRKFASLLKLIILSLVPILFLYSSVSVYRLNYALTFLFALILIQQFAPKLGDEEEEKPNETNEVVKEQEDKLDQIKMKLD